METLQEKVEQFKEIISNYWQMAPEEIAWETPLSGQALRNFSSLRMLRFLASVEERFGVTIADPDAIRRFSDLLTLIEAG